MVLSLATKVGEAYSDIPCLGVDIVREYSTDKLYILETNSGGNVWHFSSKLSVLSPPEHNQARYNQFGALTLTADLLV